MAKRTEITIDQMGNFKIDQQGFTGTACAETTAKLMQGIRSKSKDEERKPEFHSRAGAVQQQRQRW